MEVGVNCYSPAALCECATDRRPLSIEHLRDMQRWHGEPARCPRVYINNRTNTATTNCKHRFDESSARFAAPCLRRIEGRAGWKVCASC